MNTKLTTTILSHEENYFQNKFKRLDSDTKSPKKFAGESVLIKSRKYTKRRSDALGKREITPVKTIDEKMIASDEDMPKSRRRNSEKSRITNKSIKSLDFTKNYYVNQVEANQNDIINKKNSSTKSLDNKNSVTLESFSALAQNELLSFINKTKTKFASVAQRGRDRLRKSDKYFIRRGQSAPHHFTEEEFLKSLKKSQLLKVCDPIKRKYSDSNLQLVEHETFLESKSVVPKIIEFLHQKERDKISLISSETEVLNPKTLNIIDRKVILIPSLNYKYLLSNLRTLSFLEMYSAYKMHKVVHKSEYIIIRKLWKRCVCQLFLLMIFCGLGGLVFKLTEGSFESYYKCGVKRVKRDFIDLLWLKSHNLREEDWKSLARSKLRLFEEELYTAHEAGMTDYSGQKSWSFLNGIVYSLTIITTIGYGHMYPKTTTGRALTIVYALIGIPLFLIALTDFGKLFTRCIKFLWSFVRRLYYTGSCRNVRKNSAVEDIFKGAQMVYEIATFRRPSSLREFESQLDVEGQPTNTGTPTSPTISNFEINDEFNLPISVALFILVAYIFCGAVIYMAIEKWNFFASFYFVFISMSTIGFGDYVPRHPVFMIGSIIYLVFGLALMSMCINVVQAKLSDTFKEASAKIGATIGLEVNEDENIKTISNENINNDVIPDLKADCNVPMMQSE